MCTGGILWVSSSQQETKEISEDAESPGRKYPTLYRRPEKSMGDISGSAVRTITLKPASAKTVLSIPAAQECSAPGTNIRERVKNRAVSVRPANFSGNSSLKVSTFACRPKNRSSPKKT